MGSRLPRVLGEDRVRELASSGRLVRLRESCLYVERVAGDLVVPSDAVTEERCQELILFALEAFDDALVGLTNHSYALAEQTDALFAELAG